MAAQHPWMPWYVVDWLQDRDVKKMHRVARSMYFDLLNHEWLSGPFPDDVNEVASILGDDRRSVAAHWPSIRPRFEVDTTSMCRHIKLEALRSEARIKSEKASKAAKNKWSRHANAHATANDVAIQSESESDSESQHSKDQKVPMPPSAGLVLVPTGEVQEFNLEAIYAEYPRKVGHAGGIKALKRQIKTAADFSKAMQGAIAFAVAMKSEGRPVAKIPYFSSWANQEQWRDYADLPAESGPIDRQYSNFQAPRSAVAESKDVKL